MKKISKMKPDAKKQLLGGVVYLALGVTVVAVTLGSFMNSFEGSPVKTSDKDKVGEKIKNDSYRTELPYNSVNIGEFTLDTPVSDSPSGIGAEIIIPPTVTDDVPVLPSENTFTDVPSNVPDSVAESPLEEEPVYSDKSKPMPEEPEEPVFEYGFDGFIKPLSGYISKEFSRDIPVYSVSMYDYRAHNGVDIVGEIGTPVKASSNGVISEVYDDYLYGTTVVIEHADGIKSVYSNLSPDLPVEITVGRAVITGEIIGGVGDSAICEAAEASHVHFEMTKNGEYVDPEEYFVN